MLTTFCCPHSTKLTHVAYTGQDTTDGKIMHLTPPPNDRSPNTLPTNQQQITPSRHAVAPAVAGRTPSKSAAVSPLVLTDRLCLPNLLLVLMCLFVLDV